MSFWRYRACGSCGVTISTLAQGTRAVAGSGRPTISGHGPDATLAVFSFFEDTIDRVGPAFEDLVRQIVPRAAIDAHPPIILGAREDPGTSRLFPRAIGSYLPHIAAPNAGEQGNDLLIAYRAAAAAISHDERLHPAMTLLWNAVRDAVWHHQARQQPKRIPPATARPHRPRPSHPESGAPDPAHTHIHADKWQ